MKRSPLWFFVSLVLGLEASQAEPPEPASPTIDEAGTVHIPAFDVPYSPLASEQSKRDLIEGNRQVRKQLEVLALQSGTLAEKVLAGRRRIDEEELKPGVARLRVAFDVSTTPERIAGVQTDIVVPTRGVSKKNSNRVLINLHGGSFTHGGRFGGQMESIPIASLGAIKVITVDYRLWPEHHFPAASEDVAKVYGELLKKYRSENIGIFGCSAGSLLTAQAMAWFQAHKLPRPGAIGLFGVGALLAAGDSNYVSAALSGYPPIFEEDNPYLAVPGLDPKSPLVAPAYSPSVLAQFPPALLISGTRDPWLSGLVYTHAQLVKAGVDARLHVWEGATHCSFAGSALGLDVPESREAWSVIVKFFDRELGS